MIPRTIEVNNVNLALPRGCEILLDLGTERKTRNGLAKVIHGPFITVYDEPLERVLFSSTRDANPFFHIMEALWMMAGRNDVAFVKQFNSNIGDYSDNGIVFHGAYGYRFRKWFEWDQIIRIGRALLLDREDRRQVLSIWDGKIDPQVVLDGGKDVPCNITATFQVNPYGRLDMTVFNRSNDLIWGAYGANVVHFSVLQELIAAHAGVPVGAYAQISANTHLYQKHFALAERLRDEALDDPYRGRGCMYPTPILAAGDVTAFLNEVTEFVEDPLGANVTCPFLAFVAKNLMKAWIAHKEKNPKAAYQHLASIPNALGTDWTTACTEWIRRREAK